MVLFLLSGRDASKQPKSYTQSIAFSHSNLEKHALSSLLLEQAISVKREKRKK